MVRRAYAKRRDENEGEIVAEFRRLGCKVELLDPPLPDLLVGLPGGRYVLVEVKVDGKPRNGRESKHGGLTDSQRAWRARWSGYPLPVVKTIQDVRGLVYERGGERVR